MVTRVARMPVRLGPILPISTPKGIASTTLRMLRADTRKPHWLRIWTYPPSDRSG